jgi:uncharacterized protein (UPF0276 family)
MALGTSQNTSRWTRRALTGLVAITAISLSACYPELYAEKDPYLAEIEAAQVGVDHGAGHNEKERGEAAHGEDPSATDSHSAPATEHGTEGH